MTLDPELVAILACPACDDRPPLRMSGDDMLICDECGRTYLVRDGIPVLLPDEAILPDKRTASRNND